MPRIARAVVRGVPRHVTQRGNRRQDVFFSDQDRLRYLSWLKAYADRAGLEVWAYCLMTNHVHLVVVGRQADSMAKAIGRAHMRYSRWINRQQGWSGHLWANRFASTPLDERHLWTAVKYVELNPVRAGIVKSTEEYPWSSASSHTTGTQDFLLFQSRPFPGPISNWSKWLKEGLNPEDEKLLRRCTYSGRPCGSESFTRDLETRLGRKLEPEKRGRKPKRNRNK